jgi:flagellar biogenesis protein FliO
MRRGQPTTAPDVATPGRLFTARERARDRRARRRSRLLRWAGGLLLLALVFFAGLALGRALEDAPAGGNQTLVRTIVPTTLTPRETVTVTVSNP